MKTSSDLVFMFSAFPSKGLGYFLMDFEFKSCEVLIPVHECLDVFMICSGQRNSDF